MKIQTLITQAAIASFLIQSAWAADAVTAKTFAGNDQKLEAQEAALYIAHRDEEPLSKFLAPGQFTLNRQKLVEAMADKLDDLRSTVGHEAPWTWQELDAAFPPKKSAKEKAAALPAWKRIEGLTKAKELGEDGSGGSLGPLRLRKSADDLPKALKDSRGATVGFSNNHLLPGSGVWNTEGAIDYPIALIRQGGPGQSIEWEIGPAVEWKLAEVQETTKQEIEELKFSVPMTFYLSPGRRKMTGTYEENMAAAGDTAYSRLWIAQAKPYFHTDFSGGHEIYGAEASLEYVGAFLGTRFALGGYQHIGSSGLQYQFRIIPKLDYSTVEKVGEHTTRTLEDEWTRVGGIVSLDFRLGGESFNPFDVGASYQLMDTLSGSGGFSSLFKAHVTWWLTENAGLTYEYSRGDTPVADKKIDLVTLGLELKY